MPDADVVQEIVSPLLARHGAGKAAIVVVAHAGDEAPAELLSAVERALTASGLEVRRTGFTELAPNPVRGLVQVAGGIDVFSIVLEPAVLEDRSGKLINALNIHRNTYAREGLRAVFWLPAWGMRAFTDYASNFLDFRTRMLELDLDCRPLDPSAESPRFFVPQPPKSFCERYGDDIARLAMLVHRFNRIAVVGPWPGGPGLLVRALAHRDRQAFVDAGGAFWVNAAAVDWRDRLARLALRMGIDSGASGKESLSKVAEYLDTHPGALMIYDGVLQPEILKEDLGGGNSVLKMGAKLVITTPRKDLSSRDFFPPQVFELSSFDR